MNTDLRPQLNLPNTDSRADKAWLLHLFGNTDEQVDLREYPDDINQ